MFLRKIVLALMAVLVFSIPTAGGRFSFNVGLGPLGLMSIIGMLALLFAVTFLLFGNRGFGRTPVPMDRSVILFGVFVALNFASVGWAEVPAIAISSSISYLQILIFVWLLLFLRSEPNAPAIILHAFFFGSLLVVLGVLYELLAVGLTSFEERLGGFDMNQNFFAYKMALGVPVAFYLFRRGIAKFRWLYLSYIPAAVFLVILSGSRAGTLALLLALLAVFWLTVTVEDQGRLRVLPKRLLLSAGVLAVLSVVLLPYLYGQFQFHLDRIATVADPMASGFGGRWLFWVAGFDVYLKNLFLGVGSGGAPRALGPYFEGDVYIFSFIQGGPSLHNAYLTIASETGTLGLLIYSAMLVSLVSRMTTFPRQEKFLCFSLLGVSLIAGLAGSLETARDFNLALFLCIMFAQPVKHSATTSSPFGRAALGRASVTK